MKKDATLQPEGVQISDSGYRAIFDALGDAILVLDADSGNILDANHRMCQIFGYTLEAAKGLKVGDLSGKPPGPGETFQCLMEKAARGEPQLFQWQAKDRQGRLFWMEVQLQRVSLYGRQQVLALLRHNHESHPADQAEGESQAHYRMVTEGSLAGVYIIQEGGFVYVNPVMAQIFGYRPEEIIQRKVAPRDLVHPEDLPLVRENIRKRLAGEAEEAHYTFRGRRRDGTIIYCESLGRTVEYQGRPAVIGTLLDITEPQRAQEELQAQKNLLKTIFAGTPDMVVLKDRNLVYQAANPAFCQFLGLTEADILGRTDFELFPRPEAEVYRRDDLAVIASGEPRVQDEEVTGAQGRKWWLQVIKSPIRNGGGKTVGLICSVRDITARKLAEEALKTQASVLQSMAEGVNVSGEDGIIFFANPAFEAMFGYEEGETIGKHVSMLNDYPPGENDRIVREIIGQLNSRGAWRGELRNRRKDGSSFYTDTRISALDNSGIKCWIAVQEDVTARKQAQEALAVAEAKYRTIFDSANDGIAMLDPETGNFLDVNRKFCEMVGYSPQETAGLTWEAFCGDTPPYTRADAWKWIRRAQRQGPQLFEWFTHDRQGRPYWLEMNLKRALIGGQDRLVVIARDISERKRGEAALRESQERFRQLAENLDAVFWMRSPDSSQLFYINPAYARIWGRSLDSLYHAPKSWLEVVHPQDRDRISEKRLRGDLGEEEFRIIRPDGEIRWVNARNFPIYDAQGKIYRVAGICVDVTERKRAEEALRETGNVLQTLIQASPLAIIALDRQHKVTIWNPAAERIFGWSAPEVQGGPAPYVPENQRGEFRAMVEAEFRGQARNDLEVRRLRKDGSLIDVSLWTAPLYNAHGEVIGAMGMFADITQKKEAEKAAEQIRRQQEAILSNILDIAWLKDRDSRYIAVNEPFSEACGVAAQDLVGKTDLDIWPAELARRYRRDDLEVMRTKKSIRVEEPMVDKRRQGLYWIETVKSPILNEKNEVVGTTGIARDITERRKMEEALRQTSRALKAITECDQAMMRATNESELLNEICRIIVEVGGYRMAWVGFAENDDGKTVRPVALKGFDAGYVNNIRVSWGDTEYGQGPVGRAIRTGEPAIIKNIREDQALAPWWEEALKRGYVSILALPLKDRQPFGALAIYATEASPFDEEEISLLVGLANDLAYGIAAIRASAEHQRAEKALRESERKLRFLTSQILTAQEEERKRVARELHDELGQALTVLKYHLVSIENKLRRDQQGLKQDCEHLQAHIDTIIENVRRLSWDLSPSILEDLGLSSSLRYLIDEICQSNNMQCALKIAEINNLFAPAAQINIYRIFQESLTNIVKHAQASRIKVDIKRHNAAVIFSVQDNGKGFPLEQPVPGKLSKHLGLTAMHERARMAGGALQISSKTGRGTKITFSIPIDPKGD
jgi:PAS domain S-box-containing protein